MKKRESLPLADFGKPGAGNLCVVEIQAAKIQGAALESSANVLSPGLTHIAWHPFPVSKEEVKETNAARLQDKG